MYTPEDLGRVYVIGIDCVSVSMICQLDIGTVPTELYFVFFFIVLYIYQYVMKLGEKRKIIHHNESGPFDSFF